MKKNWVVFLLAACFMAACLFSTGALAELTWVPDLQPSEEWILYEDEYMTNNAGRLTNYGTVINNLGTMLNYGTLTSNSGVVYNRGTVTYNHATEYYEVEFNAENAQVRYGEGFLYTYDTYWANPEKTATIYVTPNQNYVLGNVKMPDLITMKEQDGVWVFELKANRERKKQSLTMKMVPVQVQDNPSTNPSAVMIPKGKIMNKNEGTVLNYGTLNLNKGITENYGTVVENQGDLLNREGGVVRTNTGNVFNLGGTIESGDDGREYYYFMVVAEHAAVRFASGFASYGGADCWLPMKSEGTVEIEPNDGYTLADSGMPDWMSLTENNGIWSLQLLANHPAGSKKLTLHPVRANLVDDNPEGSQATIEAPYTMNSNRGTVDNYGTLRINYGTVRNREGGLVVINNGSVYNYDGTVDKNSGTVYDPVYLSGADHVSVDYLYGFTSYDQRQWLTPGAEAKMTLTPENGYVIESVDAPDWVSKSQDENGYWTLLIPEDRPEGNLQLRLETPNIRNDNPAGTVSTLYSGQNMNLNGGTLTILSGAELQQNAGIIDMQSGTVKQNLAGGTVKRNRADGIIQQNAGNVEDNRGTIQANSGSVTTNGMGGLIETNDGTVQTNRGTVRVNNQQINTNASGGTIKTNNGRIINDNSGSIGTNNAPLGKNTRAGRIDDNRSVISSNAGTVLHNSGTISSNTGSVENYGGKVQRTPEGTVTEYYSVEIDFPYLRAEYSEEFRSYDGRRWLSEHQSGSIRIELDDEDAFITADPAPVDRSFRNCGNGVWVVTISDMHGNLTLHREESYAITVSAEHGTLIADRVKAMPGDQVTLVLEPENSSYQFGELEVLCGNDPVEITRTDDTHYTFFMPEGEVNARAVFVHTGFVMFLNWNSYFLEMNEIHAGETPEYTGETPVRESTAEYDYIFTGWEPEISPMPEDEVFVTYTAVYSSRPRNYAVIFTGADGTPLQIDQYPYGSTPEYTEETPVRAADEHYSYRFLRWEPEIGPVTETTVYTAVFDATPILHEGENPLSLTMYEPKICPFTPAQTGYYRIYTVGEEIHPDLIITDETGKRLIMEEDERLKWWNINTDGIMNFEYLVSLEGGKTYGMKLEAGFASGEISVFVERVDMIPIHYDPEMEHGTVEGPAEAWEGQLIDFYARGDDGYGMVRMTVRDESGELFRIEDPDRQLYGYYMPDSEVYVSCEFAPAYPVTADIGEHILFSMDSAIRQDFDDEGGWMLSAAEGALLEFRLELDDRCALDTLSVTSPRGDVEFNTYQKDLYEYDLWFTMPAEPVTLTAGAVTTACMVTFDPGEGSGTMDPVTAETGKPFELPWCEFTEPDMKIFIAWQIGDDTQNLRNPEETVILEGDTTLTAVWYPVSMLFGISELPEDLIHIQPEAFEGSAVSVVWLPDSCTSIGAYAFRNCKYLLAIRIPEGCSLGTGVFDGCPMVFVYGKTGSAAERYCNEHGNCHFESED